MTSIEELKKRLPLEALNIFEKTFSQSIYNSLLLAFREKRKTTFRVNPLKSTKREVIDFLNKNNYKFTNIEYIDNAFILLNEDEKRLLKSNFVNEGKIYLQSISSLIPPLILEPKENEKILDLAASPGSKTTQIAALTNNRSLIDAVEPDFIRMERLKYNIELLNATMVNLYNTNGQQFCKDKKNYYDRILLDAPCSGEGRFGIHDKKSYYNWKLKDIEKISNLQKKLLKSALYSLKSDGVLVYSTCTLNTFENEMVIDDILKDSDLSIEIVPISEKFRNIKESYPPILSYQGTKFDDRIKNALRILPSKNLEGFFITKIKKH